MTLVLAWTLAIIAVLGLGFLGYRLIVSLPGLLERYIQMRERIRQEKLKTQLLEMRLLNEQMRDPDDHGPDEWER
jgi:hypothetical protein